MIKVSVIIPIYNVEKYIERCARALFEQTLDKIEYVFVNDCTPDNSIEILKKTIEEYPSRKPFVQIVSTPQNSGLPTARKTGIPLTTGEYIAHCDSDDWPEPTMYEKLYNKAIEEDADIVYCDYFRSSDSKKVVINQRNSSRQLMTGPIWNKLIKGSLCKDNYIIYPTANKAEDGALMVQYCYYARKISYVHEPLHNYYVNEQSMTQIMTEDKVIKRLHEEMTNIDLRIQFLHYHHAEDKYKDDIISWKYACKKNLLPFVHKDEYYKMWCEVYPEIDKEILLSKLLPLKSKILYFLVKSRLFGGVKRFVL